jgi:hypothetical protein
MGVCGIYCCGYDASEKQLHWLFCCWFECVCPVFWMGVCVDVVDCLQKSLMAARSLNVWIGAMPVCVCNTPGSWLLYDSLSPKSLMAVFVVVIVVVVE